LSLSVPLSPFLRLQRNGVPGWYSPHLGWELSPLKITLWDEQNERILSQLKAVEQLSKTCKEGFQTLLAFMKSEEYRRDFEGLAQPAASSLVGPGHRRDAVRTKRKAGVTTPAFSHTALRTQRLRTISSARSRLYRCGNKLEPNHVRA